ncbi:MAG: hypothetical protein A2792_01365 [Sphingomonadales bacterium RIFCSPHIGHO2_01_FULL_65_20]|nr:MAG: hypothetical protein A2792_01365 [Sphingomonadales bacterium RIFCSPHIGHO2_01_FULL_65_20]
MAKFGKTIRSRAPSYSVRQTPRRRRRPERPERPLGLLAEIVAVFVGVGLSALSGLFVAARLFPFGAVVVVTYAVVLTLGSGATFIMMKRLPARLACLACWACLIALGLTV